MDRARPNVAVAAAVMGIALMGIALGGCSALPSMPSWLSFPTPGPAVQTLRFESMPPGADVRTMQGQSCRTPCALALPLTPQSVTFAMNGFMPQTVPVEVTQAGEAAFGSASASVDFSPNPVEVALLSAQPVPPPRRSGRSGGRPRPRKAGVVARRPARPQEGGTVAPTTPAPPPPMVQPAPPFPPPPTR